MKTAVTRRQVRIKTPLPQDTRGRLPPVPSQLELTQWIRGAEAGSEVCAGLLMRQRTYHKLWIMTLRRHGAHEAARDFQRQSREMLRAMNRFACSRS